MVRLIRRKKTQRKKLYDRPQNSATLHSNNQHRMISNAVDGQHTRRWRELKPMLHGRREAHGCCEIDEHRMIILGGRDGRNNGLSRGFIYDARTKESTPLPNDMPAARYWINAVASERYMYVIGGMDENTGRVVNTVFCLSLETYEWTTLALMGTARCYCAGLLLDDYIYMLGGRGDDHGFLASVERYSIVGNTWEDLPDMAAARWGLCAVAALRNIYILGDARNRVLEVFDTSLLEWKAEASLCDMPGIRHCTAAVVLKNRYLVVIGGRDEDLKVTAGCLIYNCSINQWSSTPASMNMITARYIHHTAAVLDEKIVVAGGHSGRQHLSSMECIDAHDILEYAPLDYPLPVEYFDQILQLGKALLLTKHT